MPAHRKLGRAGDLRKAILRNLVTTLITEGRVTTTLARAKDVQRIAEKLITLAVREKDNFTTREIVVSAAKLDSMGKKVLESKTSKNGKKYDVVVREAKTKTVQVDNPSRLAARKQALQWLNRNNQPHQTAPAANKLFDELAQKYSSRTGGYSRITQLGTRRGDASEMALLELL